MNTPLTRPPRLTIRDAEVEGRRVDVTVIGRVITEIVPAGDDGVDGDDSIDAAGGALIPGLHDHHIHLMATAAARESITVDSAFVSSLQRSTSQKPAGEWLRAVGYHESTIGDIDRAWLDAIAPRHPVRVQHRSGAMWVLNSLALDAIGVESETGVLIRLDDAIRSRVPSLDLDLTALGRELASYGVTGVSDLTPSARIDDVIHLADRVRGPEFPVEVMVTGSATIAVDDSIGVLFGPAKVIVGDHQLPSIDDLVNAYGSARTNGRCVAVHCVTRIGLILALAAWQQVGAWPGDRIEHGAVVPAELIPTIHALGLTVVTQPSFVCERGDDYLDEVDPEDLDGLWRCASLLDNGIAVGASTDAPYGSADPWRAVASAAQRRTSSGQPIGREERVNSRRALAMFLSSPLDPGGPARRVACGHVGDLCLLDAPLDVVLQEPSSRNVVATIGRSGITTRNEMG